MTSPRLAVLALSVCVACSSGDGGPPRDAGAREAGPIAPPAPGSPGEILHNFVFEVRCPEGATGASCDVPDAERNKETDPILFGGDPAVTYRVRLRICGAVEGREYSGCQAAMAGGLFCPGGSLASTDALSDTYPSYEMKVSAPARSYFLNSRRARDSALRIEYSAELDIQGGASIGFATASRTPATATARSGPHLCPDVPGIEQPFAGQFIHFQVESVTPAP